MRTYKTHRLSLLFFLSNLEIIISSLQICDASSFCIYCIGGHGGTTRGGVDGGGMGSVGDQMGSVNLHLTCFSYYKLSPPLF